MSSVTSLPGQLISEQSMLTVMPSLNELSTTQPPISTTVTELRNEEQPYLEGMGPIESIYMPHIMCYTCGYRKTSQMTELYRQLLDKGTPHELATQMVAKKYSARYCCLDTMHNPVQFDAPSFKYRQQITTPIEQRTDIKRIPKIIQISTLQKATDPKFIKGQVEFKEAMRRKELGLPIKGEPKVSTETVIPDISKLTIKESTPSPLLTTTLVSEERKSFAPSLSRPTAQISLSTTPLTTALVSEERKSFVPSLSRPTAQISLSTTPSIPLPSFKPIPNLSLKR